VIAPIVPLPVFVPWLTVIEKLVCRPTIAPRGSTPAITMTLCVTSCRPPAMS
jgi:hypothetical protein